MIKEAFYMIGELRACLNSCHKIYIASFMPINSVFEYYIDAKCIKTQVIFMW